MARFLAPVLVLVLLCAAVRCIDVNGSVAPPSPQQPNGSNTTFCVDAQVSDGDSIAIAWYTYYAGHSLVQLGPQHAKIAGDGLYTTYYAYYNGTKSHSSTKVTSFNEGAGTFNVSGTTCVMEEWCTVGAFQFYGEMISPEDTPEQPSKSELIQVFSQGTMKMNVSQEITFKLINEGNTVYDNQGFVVAYEDVPSFSRIMWQPSGIYGAGTEYYYTNLSYNEESEVLHFDKTRNHLYMDDQHTEYCGGIGMPYCYLDQV